MLLHLWLYRLQSNVIYIKNILKIFTQGRFLIAFRKRGREREKHRWWEKSINWLPPVCALAGDWTCNQGMCPDWESNPQPFGYGTMLQPAEPHWPGPAMFFTWTSPWPYEEGRRYRSFSDETVVEEVEESNQHVNHGSFPYMVSSQLNRDPYLVTHLIVVQSRLRVCNLGVWNTPLLHVELCSCVFWGMREAHGLLSYNLLFWLQTLRPGDLGHSCSACQ